MTYSYDEEPKKHRAELSARDRKIDYLEELVRTGIEQQKKWQQRYFDMKQKFEACEKIKKEDIAKKVKEYVEANNGTKGPSPENMQ